MYSAGGWVFCLYMKGFFIEITNKLLEPKHVKAMGSAVWEFMWCLDKMTKVDDDGNGWVLGGRPVKRDDIKKDLGKSITHISGNLQKLQKSGYLTLKRTPYGNSIFVHKAKKRYNQKVTSSRNDKVTSRRRKRSLLTTEKVTSDDGKGDIYNRQDNIQDSRQDSVFSKLPKNENEIVRIDDLIFEFKEVNPSFMSFNRFEEDALTRLVDIHGRDNVRDMIKFATQKSGTSKFAPVVTKPTQLEDKWGDLIIFFKKEKMGRVSRGRGIIV